MFIKRLENIKIEKRKEREKNILLKILENIKREKRCLLKDWKT
jgi:hypothetical protein